MQGRKFLLELCHTVFPKGGGKCMEGAQDRLQLIDNYTAAKEQFHTRALAGIHASTMSCDDTHIHVPNTQYATAQAWICSCRPLLSHSFLQMSHVQLKQSWSGSATCKPFTSAEFRVKVTWKRSAESRGIAARAAVLTCSHKQSVSLILDPSFATPDWRDWWGGQPTKGKQPQFTAAPASDAISRCARLVYWSVHAQRGLPNTCLSADHAGCIATSHLLQNVLLHFQDFFLFCFVCFCCKSIQNQWSEVRIYQQDWRLAKT